jgi:antitoxin HigA-1
MSKTEAPMMAPLHPGTILQEDFLVPLGISASRLAKSVGVSPRRIGGILEGNRRINADTALRLSRFFGLSDEFWMRLQGHYDVEVERDRLGATLASIEPLAARS